MNRMHARIDGREIKLLTRTDLDWFHRYRRTIEALGALKVKSAYLDGGAEQELLFRIIPLPTALPQALTLISTPNRESPAG